MCWAVSSFRAVWNHSIDLAGKQASPSENSVACRVAESRRAPVSVDAGFLMWKAWRLSGSAISGRVTRFDVENGEVRGHFRPARRAAEPEHQGC